MVDQSSMNLLFFFGVLIPAFITVILFVIFCYCWYKMRIRNQILYKKHDPHKIEELRSIGKNYESPPPPPPPFKSASFLNDTLNHNNNNKNKSNDNYEESPEPTEGFDNPAMYRTNADSGFSDLNQIQCNVDSSAHVQRSDSVRPNSQASDDSDDSGFRSSRSGQYIHSASSSTGNAQDSCVQGVHSLQVHDAVPLFKPIKIHPNEIGQQPLVSYINRNSSRHKNVHRQRLPIPQVHTSQNFSVGNNESHSTNTIDAINSSQQHVAIMPSITSGQSCSIVPYISKSINDVHGGRLHSIDSHVGPVPSAGNYGLKLCSDNCSNRHTMYQHGYYGDGTFSQPNSIGYGSDTQNFGPAHSIGYIGPVTDRGPIKHEQLCYSLPFNNQISMNRQLPVSSHIPGYNITSSSHMRPINPDIGIYGARSSTEPSQKLTITQAMVHQPYIEELSDPTLYSVV